MILFEFQPYSSSVMKRKGGFSQPWLSDEILYLRLVGSFACFLFPFSTGRKGSLKRTPSIIRFELQNFNLIELTRSILNTPQVISKSRPQHIIGRNGSGSCSAVRCLPLDGCVTIDNSESGKVCDPDQEPSAGNSFLNRTQN